MKDYYNILGVDKTASDDAIQKAFRKLAHKYHPDKKGGDVAKFKEINEAYQVLGDKQKRAQYDATGGTQGFEGFDFSNFDVNFSGAAGSGFADILNSIFSGAMNRGADVQADISVSFAESVFGVTKTLHIPYRRKGTETVQVPVPSGIQSGAVLRMSGLGEPPQDSRAAPGNLYIRVTVQNDSRFNRHGGDVVTTLTLTPTEALLGTKKDIKDIRGETISVTVPEMSGEGTALPIQGRGIPQPVGTGRLVVLCKIIYPKSISSRARTLLQDLRKEGW